MTVGDQRPTRVQFGAGFGTDDSAKHSGRGKRLVRPRQIRCMMEELGGAALRRRSSMKVKDVMHKGVDWVSPDTPVAEIAKLMQGHDVGCIPVGQDDRLIGMVTDRDLVCKGLASKDFNS